jgi:hypothetical protein
MLRGCPSFSSWMSVHQLTCEERIEIDNWQFEWLLGQQSFGQKKKAIFGEVHHNFVDLKRITPREIMDG